MIKGSVLHLLFLVGLVAFLKSCGLDNSQEDSQSKMVEYYNQKAESYLNSQPDSALHYTQLSLEVSDVTADHSHDKATHFIQARAYRRLGKLSEALKSGLKAKAMINPASPDSLDPELELMLGQTYAEAGQYDNALNGFHTARELFREFSNQIGQARALNNLALIYYRINDLDKAREYNQKGLEIWQTKGDQAGLASCYTINGYLLAAEGEFAAALENHSKAQESFQALNDNLRYSNSFLNIGEVHLKQGEFDRAEAAFREALTLSEEVAFVQIRVDGFNKLGQCYTQQERFSEADSVLNLGLRKAEEISDQSLLAEFYQALAELYQKMGKSEKAIFWLGRHQEMKDKIFSNERGLRISEFEVLYETRQIQERNRQLEAEKNRRQLWIIFGAVTTALLLLLMFVLFSRYRIRVRFLQQQKKLDEQKLAQQELENTKLEAETKLKEEENNRLQAEVEHRINELSSVTMHLYEKNEALSLLLDKMRELEASSGADPQTINQISRSIRQNLNLDDDWERFKIHFDQVYQGFFDRLADTFPKLTSQDLRHCAYIRMNLSTKEIARLLNINPTSVQRSRVRLKQKLGLSQQEDLSTFIRKY